MSGPTGDTGPTGDIGPTGDTGPTMLLTLASLTGVAPPDPPRIRLSDLMTDLSVLQQQEAADRTSFLAVTSPDLSSIRSNLITWIAAGRQGNCVLMRVPLSVPNVCSDGVSRNFFEYVEFVSGKSLASHVQSIQDILPDFEVGYQCSRNEILVCVVRVMA